MGRCLWNAWSVSQLSERLIHCRWQHIVPVLGLTVCRLNKNRKYCSSSSSSSSRSSSCRTRKDVGAECRHDMRPSVQLPSVDSQLGLTTVRARPIVCSRCLSCRRLIRRLQVNMYARYAAISWSFWRPVIFTVDFFNWKLAFHFTRARGQSIGEERAVLPLRVKARFCDLRSPLHSRSATSRSALRSAPLVFSTPVHRSTPLRSRDFSACSAPVPLRLYKLTPSMQT